MKYLCHSRYITIDSITTNTTNTSDTGDTSNSYKITITISKKVFQWKVVIFKRYDGSSIHDVVPLKVMMLNDVNGYNYYDDDIITSIMMLNSSNSSNSSNSIPYIIKEIGSILLSSLLQKDLIQRSLDQWKDDVVLSFIQSFFCSIHNTTILTINNNNTNHHHHHQSISSLSSSSSSCIIIEVPIILNMIVNEVSEYLISIVRDNPILLAITITTNTNTITNTTDINTINIDVTFPNSMKASSHLKLNTLYTSSSSSSSSSSSIKDFKVEDIVNNIEDKILNQWYYRKCFVEELLSSSSVLEYDAIDFSNVLVAVRIKHNNVFASCTIEFIFFGPMMLPQVNINDLLRSFNTSMDITSGSISNYELEAYQLARELLKQAVQCISTQAFSNHIYV